MVKNKRKKSEKDQEVILIDAGYAYVEAVKLLVLAGKKARHSGDFDKIAQVADLWIELGERLGTMPDDEGTTDPEPIQIGFRDHGLGGRTVE